MARPQATITLPTQHETVILAMDISGSMRATDVEPNRLVAAQNAAKQFVAEQPENVRVGVVAFAGTATVAQAPTRNREDVIAAIDRFQLQRATAIGSAIIVSLATIFPRSRHRCRHADLRPDSSKTSENKSGAGRAKPVPPGSYASAVIILLTDGQRTTGPDSIRPPRWRPSAACASTRSASARPRGKIIGFEGWSMRVRLDEETLKRWPTSRAASTSMPAMRSTSRRCTRRSTRSWILERKKTEITALFAGLAALLAVVSAALSLAWFHRVI